jgi:endonuclease YncB( thermonuclease family)
VEAFRQWFRGRSFWIKALIVVVSLLLALSLLRVLFANSFWVFLVPCAVVLLLRAVHRRRSGGNPAVEADQTIGRIGATALSAAFVCMLVFGGTAIAKAIMRSPEPPAPTTAVAPPEPREETTRAETTAEGTTRAPERTREETTRRPEPQPAPEPAPEPEPEPAPEPERSPYDATVTVSRVVDGDTIEISPAVEGVSEVRLIGVDTPETKNPNEEVEPLGPEASEFATSALQGQEIGVELDAETADRYGRLLAYVYLGEEMFNETLIEEGYAQVWFIPPTRSTRPNSSRRRERRYPRWQGYGACR